MKVLLSIIAVLVLSGCNNDNKIVVVDGDPIVVKDDFTLECGEVYELTAASKGETVINYTGGDELTSKFGMDIQSTFTANCGEAQVPVKPENGECPADYVLDENVDMCFPKKEETKPEVPAPDCNGNCPEGYKKTDCNTCVAVPCPKCGEGTELDGNNTCVVIPEVIEPVECEDGFRAVDNKCMAIRYVPFKTTDCMDGYKFRKKLNICKLQEK